VIRMAKYITQVRRAIYYWCKKKLP
jgi:hypothetical protein